MKTRSDLERLENTLNKVRNKPDTSSEAESSKNETTEKDESTVKKDFKNFMNSPLQSTNKPINLNLSSTEKAATIGGAGGASIGYALKNKAKKDTKGLCDALSTDCAGNKTEVPSMIKDLHKANQKAQLKSTVVGGVLGAGAGVLLDKITSGKGLKLGRFKLKIGR